ncbi:T9SS type A sorting domain-containing protein [Flavobacteriales bacterium]|nr:T9SS type A sorting domain-containing protein [Flavobacteriales bacterium]
MRFLLLCVILISTISNSLAQSTIYVRNSTWQDFDVSVSQSGTIAVVPSEWAAGDTVLLGWLETTGQELLTVNRSNSAVPEGDTAFYDISLEGFSDTLTIKLRVIGVSGGTSMDFTIDGNLFSIPFFNDDEFHEVQTSLAGKDVVLKFKADNDDSELSRNVRFAIHDLPIYEIPESDFQDPNIMNVMFYNVQMITFGVSGMPQASERGALLPAQISQYQDVVAFSEAFDDGPREDDLIPAMTAAGFPYRTEILNPPGLIPIPTNGGVIIFSKWPIETEEDIDFAECGQAAQDCLANKGVKYARVNKLGKLYHIFGTHMDAGSGADDMFARRTQMAEIRDFIADLEIPEDEAVIFGGDFNTDPIGSDMDYQAFLDTMNPIIPEHIGFYESNFNDDFGKVIDHAWGDRTHLVPTVITNEIITMRSLDPVLWDLSEFSDHRCILSRYTYPDISKAGGDTLICPGESLTLSVNTDFPVTYQWSKGGVELSGETNATLEFTNALESQSGEYSCLVIYDVLYGTATDSLNALFYPNGSEIVEARLTYEFGEIVIDQFLCEVGVEEYENSFIQVHPNPANDRLFVNFLEPSQSGTLSVYSPNGKRVYQDYIQSSKLELDVSEYQSGLYLMEFNSSERLFHQRFVVY